MQKKAGIGHNIKKYIKSISFSVFVGEFTPKEPLLWRRIYEAVERSRQMFDGSADNDDYPLVSTKKQKLRRTWLEPL